MCKSTRASHSDEKQNATASISDCVPSPNGEHTDSYITMTAENGASVVRKRRGKRERYVPDQRASSKKIKRKQSHQNEHKGGGIEALLPSIAGVLIFAFAVMARLGFRGRIDVAGIDLGTTNSVICVQALSSAVGKIACIPDPVNDSPLVPSVVSFLHQDEAHHHRSYHHKSGSGVVVGHAAKLRIDLHPHSTFYHAKRFLGRNFDSDTVSELRREVQFGVIRASAGEVGQEDMPIVHGGGDGVLFQVPGGYRPESLLKGKSRVAMSPLRSTSTPELIGSFVVKHLLRLAERYLGYDNIKTAVIAVPAKFDSVQRQATVSAFKMAGIKVARMLEEPTAAALAYGLHRKPGVNHILVYDFGGGTLDVSVLHVSDGYVDVIGSEGDDTLGGADFDNAVAHFLMNQRDYETQLKMVASALDQIGNDMEARGDIESSCELIVDVEEELAEHCAKLERTPLCHSSSFHTIGEKMKIALSNNEDRTEFIAVEGCYGLPEEVGTGQGLQWTLNSFCESLQLVNLTLSQTQFDLVVENLYDRSLLPVRRVLNNLDLTSEDIDEVVMVGGTTRLPNIRKLVKKELRVSALNTHIDPDITVAYGAASVID